MVIYVAKIVHVIYVIYKRIGILASLQLQHSVHGDKKDDIIHVSKASTSLERLSLQLTFESSSILHVMETYASDYRQQNRWWSRITIAKKVTNNTNAAISQHENQQNYICCMCTYTYHPQQTKHATTINTFHRRRHYSTNTKSAVNERQ